jgi:acetylglutamate kinase
MENVCIKIGGSTLDTPEFFIDFAKSIKEICNIFFPIIVHGGGKDIAKHLELLNKEYKFIEGMRVTDAETVSIVQMVLSGDVNKRIVNALLKQNIRAIGISGVDCNFLCAERMTINGQDIGFVGDIKAVDTYIIEVCKKNGIVPVISPISRDKEGNIYNVNADLAASKIANVIKVQHLLYISDVSGVILDGKVSRFIKTTEIEKLIQAGFVKGGMIPKLRSAKESVEAGVSKVHICKWNGVETLKTELSSNNFSGTIILQ